MGAIAFHQQGLFDQTFGAVHMRHHQEANRVEAELARRRDVLFGDISLGAMGGHADRGNAIVLGHMQVIDGTDARQEQGRHLGAFHQRDHRTEVFLVGMHRKAVIDRTATEAIAMSDFEQRHTSGIKPAGHRLHLLKRHLMPLRVHAIAQGHIMQSDFHSFETAHLVLHFVQALTGASLILPARISSANISAVRAAAAVMMSRLPAYLGR